jgi:FKBP-type peptidyl-prolyl cis-trans isomerase FklB
MNDTANISFLIGLQVGMQLNQGLIQFAEGAEFDRATVLKAFKETLNADSVDFEQLRMTLDSLMNIVQDRVAKKLEEKKQNDPVSIQNRITGKAFIDKLIKEDASVKQTESGLAYKVVTEGTGAKPVVTDRVVVMYKGMLIDGTEFDSSYKRNQPSTFRCNQVIKGWTEALSKMPVGSKWELYIPYDLAYGDRNTGQIKPYSTLIFTVELLGIKE